MDNSAKETQSVQIPWHIKLTAKTLYWISPKLAMRFAMKLFVTPIRFKTPEREYSMLKNSIIKFVEFKNKRIRVFENGIHNKKKALVVHGWSGRGTQMFKIVNELVALGYHVISFDAPGHGKSSGKKAIMIDFIESIEILDKKYEGFEVLVGHSLGGMSILNSIKRGVKTKKAVILGSGDTISEIIENYIQNLSLNKNVAKMMKKYFDLSVKEDVDNYSASLAAKDVDIPVMIFHDKKDIDVFVSCAKSIRRNLSKGELFLTEGLGHRRILGSKEVLSKMNSFIAN